MAVRGRRHGVAADARIAIAFELPRFANFTNSRTPGSNSGVFLLLRGQPFARDFFKKCVVRGLRRVTIRRVKCRRLTSATSRQSLTRHFADQISDETIGLKGFVLTAVTRTGTQRHILYPFSVHHLATASRNSPGFQVIR